MSLLKQLYELSQSIASIEAELNIKKTEYAILLDDARKKNITHDNEYEVHIPTKYSSSVNVQKVHATHPDIWDECSYVSPKDAETIIGKQKLRNYIKTNHFDKYKARAKIYVSDLEKKFGSKASIPPDLTVINVSEGDPIIIKK